MADFYAVHRSAIERGVRDTREGEYFHIHVQEPFASAIRPKEAPSMPIVTFCHGVGGKHLLADKASKAVVDDWSKAYESLDDWNFP